MSFPFEVQLCDGEEYTTSVTKEHPLGTRGITQDGRAFRYCRADDTYGVTLRGWSACDTHSYNTTDLEDAIEGATTAAAVAGDFTLNTLDSGTHAADFFAEGYAALTVGSQFWLQWIKSSTAAGASTTLTFHDPLKTAVALGSQIQVFPSPYSAVASEHPGSVNDYADVTVCVPLCPVTVECYFWGQTWGPCYMVPTGTFPKADRALELVFEGGGVNLPSTTAGYKYQRAGYRLFDYSADPTGALIYMMLQIQP